MGAEGLLLPKPGREETRDGVLGEKRSCSKRDDGVDDFIGLRSGGLGCPRPSSDLLPGEGTYVDFVDRCECLEVVRFDEADQGWKEREIVGEGKLLPINLRRSGRTSPLSCRRRLFALDEPGVPGDAADGS